MPRVVVYGIPAVWIEPPGAAGPCVLVLHGLGAGKERQGKELDSLAAAGFAALCPDAPHHGERADGFLEEFHAANGGRQHELLLTLVEEAIAEIPRLVDACRERGAPRVGVVGISMGAYVALGAAPAEPRLEAVASLLGSPDWTPREGAATPLAQERMARAPIHRLGAFVDRPLLLGNAGLDVNVPPEPARRMAETLRAWGAARLEHLEYPHSTHFLRAEDWDDLWGRTLAFLARHLR